MTSPISFIKQNPDAPSLWAWWYPPPTFMANLFSKAMHEPSIEPYVQANMRLKSAILRMDPGTKNAGTSAIALKYTE